MRTLLFSYKILVTQAAWSVGGLSDFTPSVMGEETEVQWVSPLPGTRSDRKIFASVELTDPDMNLPVSWVIVA